MRLLFNKQLLHTGRKALTDRPHDAHFTPLNERDSWQAAVEPFQHPSTVRSIWQLINTLVPYVLLWLALYLTISISLWITIPLVVLASGFLVRIFIIFHDCGHGSYLRSRRANDIIGFVTGVLTFSPHRHWSWEHAIHHGGAGNLNKRGRGDIWTMTVQEYSEASRPRRVHYRLVRSPVVLFLLAPIFVFAIKHRFSADKAPRRARRSVWLTNLALSVMVVSLSWLLGLWTYLILQAAMLMISGAAGLWLFYVQHQFEGVYWERGENWSYTTAALQGSSYYKLPKVLQWFSGNIGFHHVHHLSPRIANYNLQKCHEHSSVLQQVRPITFWRSFESLTFRLWDEQRKKLVGFGEIKDRQSRRLG